MTTEPDPFPEHDVDGDQEQLLPLDLPDYNGRKPSGMKTSVNGAGNRISQAHDIGDRVVVLVEARVKRAGHEEVDDGIVYAETLKVVDLFELPPERGRDLLTEARQLYRRAEDEPRAEPGAPVTVDGSGVAATPAELAAMRGEAVEDMTWIVTFEDKHQRTWPTEFPDGAPVPVVGQSAQCTQCREGEGAARTVTMVRPPWDGDPPDADEPAAAGEVGPFDQPAEVAFSGDGPDDELEADDSTGGDQAEGPITPDSTEFGFVDRKVDEIRADLAAITDRDQLFRYRAAEEQGRGRGLQPRKGVLEALDRRAAELFSDHASVPAAAAPEPAGFDVPDDALPEDEAV